MSKDVLFSSLPSQKLAHKSDKRHEGNSHTARAKQKIQGFRLRASFCHNIMSYSINPDSRTKRARRRGAPDFIRENGIRGRARGKKQTAATASGLNITYGVSQSPSGHKRPGPNYRAGAEITLLGAPPRRRRPPPETPKD
jgi:hypothetical protein